MEIPVYGLSGIDGLASKLSTAAAAATAAHGGAVRGAQRATRRYGSFERYLSNIQNPRLRSIKADKNYSTLRGLEGIFKVTGKKIEEGKATVQEKADFNKASVLITLADTDYDAYRLASIYMPYVVDIDPNDGGYIFPSLELAQIAAVGEEQFMAYCNSPTCTEYGKQAILGSLGNWLKSIGKAVKNVGKSVVNAGKAAVQSVANVAKATANTVKATAQLVTGNAKGAGETMKKAGQQLISAAVDPVKTAVKDTVTMVKDSVDIFKETISIAGKVFKVLFIKINPVTVMIRNSWRGLLAINFLGMATRLGVGLMTWADAEKAGYSYDIYNKAVNAVNKAKKMYKKMGGNADKLVKSIKNGANKKPLFKSDIRPDTKINFASNEDTDTTLSGDPATIATLIAACAGIITQVWSWVKDIISMKKQSNAEKEMKQQQEEQKKYNAEHYELDANGNPIVDQYGRPVPKGQIDADIQAAKAAAQQQAAVPTPDGEGSNTKKIIMYTAIGAAVVFGGAMLMGGKSKKKRR